MAVYSAKRAARRGGDIRGGEEKKPAVPRTKDFSQLAAMIGIEQRPRCLVCTQACLAYYGRWGDGGTCSAMCEKVQAGRRSA